MRKSINSQKELFEEITHLKRMMRSERDNSVSSQLSTNFKMNNSGLKNSILKSNNNSLRNSSTLMN